MSSTRIHPGHDEHPDHGHHGHHDRDHDTDGLGAYDAPMTDEPDGAAGYDEAERRDFQERAERVEERLHALDEDEPDEALRPRHHEGVGNAAAQDLPDHPGAAGGLTTHRRESTLEQVEDGGYGVGSARPLGDGLVPLGHRIKAWEDTKTYVLPGHPRYDDAEPHVWFLDVDAAERNGFRAAGH